MVMTGTRDEKLVKMGEGKRGYTYCRTLCEEAAVEGLPDSVCLFSLAYDSSRFPSSYSSSLEMVQAQDCEYLTEDSANQDNMDADATLVNSIHICCVKLLIVIFPPRKTSFTICVQDVTRYPNYTSTYN